MAQRDEILAYLASFLETWRFRDGAPSGLQVEGRAEVRRVASGVSASLAFFERAQREDADLLLVHHGLFWQKESRVLAGPAKARVKYLLERDVTLAAYHLPLDAHAEVGNNALALRELGARDLAPFGVDDGQSIGWRGSLAPIAAGDLFRRISALYGREPLVFASGPPQVRSIGVVSGAGQSFLRQAIDARLDCFVTGEVSEWVMSAAAEAGIHFVSAGHHATERVGIRALGEHVAKKFGVEHVFVDVPNPV